MSLVLTIAAVFLSVALASGSLAALAFNQSAPGRRRLKQLSDRGTSSLLVDKNESVLAPTLGPGLRRFAMFIPKSPKEMSRLQKRLATAGFYGIRPLLVFRGSRFLLPATLGVVAFVLSHGAAKLPATLIAGAIGYVVPDIMLARLTAKHQKIIQNGLPDALDLFIVCLEAGSSLDQAILKTSQDLDVPYPPLAEELRMITTEMRAGKPRLEAFKNFATRTGVDDVRALVNMLVQADRFGTSIALALRTHADTARTKRRQRAEERAQKIGVKLVFPLAFCLFPAFYVVTLGSSVVKFMHFFSEQVAK
jgi:tight adherence protein C